MSVRDLLNVGLHNDNLKTFNQTWRETLMAVGSDMDESLPDMLQRRTVEEVLSCAERVIVVPEWHCRQKVKGMVNDILENQQQHMLISQEERSKDRAAVSLFKEERRRKRQELLVLDFKRIVFARRTMLLPDMTQRRKAREKVR